MAGLNKRQARFVEEYLLDLNATQAAVRAGYDATNADVTGPRLLGNVGVAEAVKSRMDERATATRIKAYRVLEELATIAFSNIDHFAIDENGNVALNNSAPADAMRAVARIKRKTRSIPQKDGEAIVEHETEIALWDKNSALDKAMKHLGIIAEKVDHTSGGKPIRFTLRIGERPAGPDDE